MSTETNMQSNVLQFETQTAVDVMGNIQFGDTLPNSNTTTVWATYPWPSYQSDEVAKLSAWIDGYTTGRVLSAKHLVVIRKKLREFCE